jgi:precorrin-6B methylase 2
MLDYIPQIQSKCALETEISDVLYKYLRFKASRMDNVLEIGAGCGKSTHALASGCAGRVWTVDHFKGSKDPNDFSFGKCLKEEFLRNLKGFANLTLLEMDSMEAVKLFADKSIDMIFIDGGHLYEEVMADLSTWIPKARKIVGGHDTHIPTVMKAVKECGLPFRVYPYYYWEINLRKENCDVAKEN